jgi:hypothetical protein
MPDYPYPSRTISPQYVRKAEGFNVPPDVGINHTSGLSKAGLDVASPGVITAGAVGSITTTGATVTWTTASLPGGSVLFMAPGGQEQIYNEAATPVTAHSAPLTGLTSGVRYTYRIVQPSAAPAATAPLIYQGGSFTTL